MKNLRRERETSEQNDPWKSLASGNRQAGKAGSL